MFLDGRFLDGRLKISHEEFVALERDVAARLVAARLHALRAYGCDPKAAEFVAAYPDVSVLDAAHLLKGGWEADAAVRMLR